MNSVEEWDLIAARDNVRRLEAEYQALKAENERLHRILKELNDELDNVRNELYEIDDEYVANQ